MASELYEDISLLPEVGPFPDLPEQRAQTVDKKRGRLEVRTLRISSALTAFLKPGWPDVAQVSQVERRVTRGDKSSCECAYGSTSPTARHATPHQVLDTIRSHWQIENVLHRRRDVTLCEDACQVSHGQTPLSLPLSTTSSFSWPTTPEVAMLTRPSTPSQLILPKP